VIVPPSDKEYQFVELKDGSFTFWIEEKYLPENETLTLYIPQLGEVSVVVKS
jgi:hypothetical protein